MFIKGNPIIIKQAFNEIYSKKPILSNCFLQEFGNDEFYISDKSFIIKKKHVDFNRLYFLTTNKSDIKEVLRKINGTNVINIPIKGKVDEWIELTSSCGYNLIGTYERYFNPDVKSKGKFTATFADISLFNSLKTMLYKNFNVYTDYLPDDKLLTDMIHNNQVMIHEEDGILKGMFIYSIVGKKCYFNVWYDESNNGLYLLFNMYNFMNQHNMSYAYCWINIKNESVKKIYTLLGSHPDGLIDYTFLKTNSNEPTNN